MQLGRNSSNNSRWRRAEASSDDDGEGDYALIDGCLYSLLKPYTTVTKCLWLVVPSERKGLSGKHMWRQCFANTALSAGLCCLAGMAKDVKAEIAECAHCEANRLPP